EALTGGDQRLLDIRDGGRRDQLAHQILGVFLEEAGGLAVLVADDAAPGRIRRLGRDPGHAKGDRVDDGHVPAGARQYGRVVGRHAVEIPAGRVALDVE